jgi:hypothetical protein
MMFDLLIVQDLFSDCVRLLSVVSSTFFGKCVFFLDKVSKNIIFTFKFTV